MKTVSICFVCLGNICRSPTAEGVMRRLAAEAKLAERIVIDSAGTGDWHVGEPPDERAQFAAARRGYELGALRGRQIAAADFERFDLLIAMDDKIVAALRQEQGPVTLAGISQRQHISLSYLEQLFGKLRRHEIVESVRGPGGGYNLARRVEDVTVADIIIAVDEPLDATQCGGKGSCEGTKQHDGHCMTHELWSTLNQKMVEYLDSVSLKDLVDQQRSREGAPTVLRDRRSEAPAVEPARVVPKGPNSVFNMAGS